MYTTTTAGCYVKLALWTQSRFAVHQQRFSGGSLRSLHRPCTLLQRCFTRMLFPLCFEIPSCWTHTRAVFQPCLWRQQAERMPLIFLPKEFSSLSLSLQTWVWLRLRYRVTLSATVVMKLAAHPAHALIQRMFSLISSHCPVVETICIEHLFIAAFVDII